MKQLLPFLFLTLQLLFYSKIEAQNSKLTLEKEPSWITVNKIDYNNKKLDGEAEDGYLDIGYERQVSLLSGASYYKKTKKILSEAGVQNCSEISVSFDPAYEKLIFHNIRIIREGGSINKLRLSGFKIIQQEKELHRHMYDGSLTALLVLEDVRKGDIIEYSYSIKGFNPIFNGRYSDVFDCNYSVPVANLYYKLIVPEGRSIIIKNRQTNVSPVITREASRTEYEWRATNIPAIHLESKIPDWYNPYGSIMLSEFQSWLEVSNWACALFPRNLPLSAELQKKVKKIKETYPNDEERTLCALRFVQDDIRYMGIEIGINSHKPNAPDKIFAQRFGDCKDKSYLLVTMLNAMGIEADPVLINTVDKKTISEQLPSGYAFDHCTVRAKVNGKVYWFDPTISFQRGTIDNIAYPDYQVGLVVNSLTTDLSSIPFQDRGLNDIKEIFTVYGMSGTARLKVITKCTGSFADDERFNFNNNSLYEIKNKYKDYYATYFDKINADSLTYEEDDATGAFTTVEYYTINDIWKAEEGKTKLFLSSFVINGITKKPSDKNRSMSFRLAYPARFHEEVEVNLPEEWPVKPFNDRVVCSNFELTAEGKSIGNKVVLNYSYETLKDHVMPSEAAAFFSKYDYAYNAVDYELSYKEGKPSSQNSSVSDALPSLGLFPKLYIMLGACVLITFLLRKAKKNTF